MFNVLVNVLNEIGKVCVNIDDIFNVLVEIYNRCQGVWVGVVMIVGFGVFVFCDSWGICFFVMGFRFFVIQEGGIDYMFVLESIVFC